MKSLPSNGINVALSTPNAKFSTTPLERTIHFYGSHHQKYLYKYRQDSHHKT